MIVYQEQIIQIVAKLAGFTMAEADLLRVAISKKNKQGIKEQQAKFIKGAIELGYDEEVADRVFFL